MGQVLVRNLDDAVIERLKQKAAARGTSLEQVAREALAAAAAVDERQAWVARMDALRAQTTPDPDWDAVAAIRALVDLDSVVRVVKVVGYVASAPDFTGQPGVVNGASELIGAAFGEAGVHARSAVGVAVLPLDAPVEVELVVEV